MTTDLAGITRSAVLSDCGRFRFELRRSWGEGGQVAWLMLNPSTADDEQDDPTLRRIQDWAARWGYHGVVVVNVFPFRASQPADLWRWLNDSRGDTEQLAITATLRDNQAHIHRAAKAAALRMVGFGAEVATAAPTDLDIVLDAFGEAGSMCLGTNKHGWPLHPMARGKSRIPDYASPTFWQRPQHGVSA